MTEDEIILFEKIRKSDEAAFRVIYDRYVPRLYYFVYEYVPFHDIVENIIQDTYMDLWARKSKLTDHSNLGAYLYTVAKNNCLYKLRDQRYSLKFISSSNNLLFTSFISLHFTLVVFFFELFHQFYLI